VPKVLVVDDDHAISAAISLRLEHHGYIVRICHSAHQASDIVLRDRPDVILLDIDMPHYTGLELHQCLLGTDHGRQIPIAYLTGQQNELVKREAFVLGAAAYIQKPYDPELLLEALSRLTSPPTP